VLGLGVVVVERGVDVVGAMVVVVTGVETLVGATTVGSAERLLVSITGDEDDGGGNGPMLGNGRGTGRLLVAGAGVWVETSLDVMTPATSRVTNVAIAVSPSHIPSRLRRGWEVVAGAGACSGCGGGAARGWSAGSMLLSSWA
jgi:hypothetical protein